jgi:hypothetical protein
MSALSSSARNTATSKTNVGPATVGSAVRRLRPPRLRLLPEPSSAVAGNGIFAVMIVGLLLAGMAALLLLNTNLAQGAFTQQALQQQQSALAVTEQLYSQQVAQAESPVTLQERANSAGMVPVTSPVFLRLSDGKVLGDPTPAAGVAPPAKATTTTTTTAAVTNTRAAVTAKPTTTGTSHTTDGAASAPATSSDAAHPDLPTTTKKSTTGPTR